MGEAQKPFHAAVEPVTLRLVDERLRAVEREFGGYAQLYSELRRDVADIQTLMLHVCGVIERSVSTKGQMTQSMAAQCQTHDAPCAFSIENLLERITAVEALGAQSEGLEAKGKAKFKTTFKAIGDVKIEEALRTEDSTESPATPASANQAVENVPEETVVVPLGEANTKTLCEEIKVDVGSQDTQAMFPCESDPPRLDASSCTEKSRSKFVDESKLETYSVDVSIWDAFLLVFCIDGYGSRIVTGFETFVLSVAFVLNLVLQSTFVLIVAKLVSRSADFSQSTTANFLEWRASEGHLLDPTTGTTQVARLCSQLSKQWNFQRVDVTTLQSYQGYLHISSDVTAGQLLSLMSLLLWSMMIMKEYRSVVSQFFGIINITLRDDVSRFSLAPGRTVFEGDDDHSFGIQDIGGGTRFLMILLLTIPRAVLLAIFSYLGVQFVAQTGGLVDLVLNAMALAFVFEIDELMASITFTQNLFRACEHMQPLPCGHHGRCRTAARWFIWGGIMLVSINMFLFPFWDSVKAAEYALCGGDKYFIVEGGTHDMPTTVIVDMADAQYDVNSDGADNEYYSHCESWSANKYMQDKYHIANSRFMAEAAEETTNPITNRKHITLQHAFRDADFSTLGAATQQVFQVTTIGGKPLLPPGTGLDGLDDCPRFYPYYQLGWDACTSTVLSTLENNPNISHCSWTRMGQLCEGMSPGAIYSNACDVTTPEAQRESCEIWRSFGLENPLVHCSNGTELEMQGAFTLTTNNATKASRALQTEWIRTRFVNQMRRSFEELPAENQLTPPVDSLNLLHSGVSLVVLQRVTAFAGTGPSRRLLSSSLVDGTGRRHLAANAETRRLQSSGDFSEEIEVRFRIDKLPATLTTAYLSKVDWATLSADVDALLKEYDPSLHVGAVSELTSAPSSATCITYSWCADVDKILKPNAHEIYGASEDVCCDMSCLFLWKQGLVTQQLCEPLGPYELIPSQHDMAITRVESADSHTVCCVEQQLCESLDVSECLTLAGQAFDALIADASTTYQGITGSGEEVNCCAMSCGSISENGMPNRETSWSCDARKRQTLVGNASSVVPSDIYDYVAVALECCETTSVFCDEWNAMNPESNCEANNKALYVDASTTLGEHMNFCCAESCANLNIRCPAEYTVWPSMQTRYARSWDPGHALLVWDSGSSAPTRAPTVAPTMVETTCSQEEDLVGPEENMVIPDDSISASSYNGNDDKCGYEFSTATRLGYVWAAWCAAEKDTNQWLQWDLGIPMRITAIRTQGHPIEQWFVTTYAVSFSLDGSRWSTMTRTLPGNSDNSQVSEARVLATVARYVRVIPMSWYATIAMRGAAVGCAAEEGFDQATHGCPAGYTPHAGHLNSELDDYHNILSTEETSTMEACAVVCNATKGCLAFQWSASSSACSCGSRATPDTDIVMGDYAFCGKREIHVSGDSQCCTTLPPCSEFSDDDCIAAGRDLHVDSNITVDTENFAEVCCAYSCSSAEALGYTCRNAYSFDMTLTENASTTVADLSSQGKFEVSCCVIEGESTCDETAEERMDVDYRGCQDHTREGLRCQKWSAQTPHTHDRTPERHPDADLGDHNYCRNPDKAITIWCYTLDSDVRWDYCEPLEMVEACETTAVGTVSEGSRCFFPFTYEGNTYDRCVPFDKEEAGSWCSTTSEYAGFWGACDCDGGCQCEPDYNEVFISVQQWGGYAYTDSNRMCATDGTQGTVSGSAALCADADAAGEIQSSDCRRDCIEGRCAAESACVGYTAPTAGSYFIPLSSIGDVEQDGRWQTFRKVWR